MEVQVWFIGDKKVSVVQKFNVKVVYFIEKNGFFCGGGNIFTIFVAAHLDSRNCIYYNGFRIIYAKT